MLTFQLIKAHTHTHIHAHIHAQILTMKKKRDDNNDNSRNNNTSCNWHTWNVHQMIGKSAGRVEEIGGQIETIQTIAYRSVKNIE